MKFTGYFIGIMTGTSLDSVDIALLKISPHGEPTFVAGHKQPIHIELREKISNACRGIDDQLHTLCTLDIKLAELYSRCVNKLLQEADIKPGEIIAIGSHGQTIRHCPDCTPPYTLQIGNSEYLSQNSGITTVSDFRQRDLVLHGQGAPLTPLFHHRLFHQNGKNIVAANLGGIANISILTADGEITGYDTGPANTLMDQWVFKHHQKPYDADAAWATGGKLNRELLDRLLEEPWLQKTPPKSTGPELFNLNWLEQKLTRVDIPPQDVQRTLCEFTAVSLTHAIAAYSNINLFDELILCGGGAFNPLLVDRISSLVEYPVVSSSHYGITPDWVEASAFAWLAFRTMNGLSGNVPAATGASRECSLGVVYPANTGIHLL